MLIYRENQCDFNITVDLNWNIGDRKVSGTKGLSPPQPILEKS